MASEPLTEVNFSHGVMMLGQLSIVPAFFSVRLRSGNAYIHLYIYIICDMCRINRYQKYTLYEYKKQYKYKCKHKVQMKI